MSDGSYATHIDVGGLSAVQRHQLDSALASEGIRVTWSGDRLHFDQAFEARIESLLAQVRSSLPPPSGPPGAAGTPPMGPAATPNSYPPPAMGLGYPQPTAYPPSAYPLPTYGATPYGAAPYGTFYPSAPVTNSSAVIALILGLASFAVCGLCCIPAIILGRKAQREIAESQGTQTGEGLAKAGWIIGTVYAGLVGIVVAVFLIALVVGSVA